ncbi:GNAT family N-acetyltransferase [Ferruginibacter sp. HRS2-29]|uniref:GNAT family N-acetyltransferase n=1 Tax=Ferruginibacter sp. HRS2-29 TaxID=2487334 RepID=UPI0020CCA5F1|nr:GNAT family N-acetyltransferase [Ferruginibacter sp. HRS2-29]MCP9752725.1 N-acetyltransferase [Ferruginibacter sp. HRS2-29]
MANRNFSPFPVLKTVRLTLRQLVATDEKEIFALRSDEHVNKYLDRTPAQSIGDAKAFIEMIDKNIPASNAVYWAISLAGSANLVGTICLFDFADDNSRAEIGYELLPGFQGKGIMQEAVSTVIDFAIRHIGVKMIEAFTHAENGYSTRLLEKFNFEKTEIAEGDFVLFQLAAQEFNEIK